MSLQQTPQSRVFVELLPWTDRGRENYLLSDGETLPGLRRPLSSAPAQTPTREVHVSGTAEVSASPDRAQVVVRVSSTKEAAAEAKKSVCRRLDYITQSLRQQGVQVRAPPARSFQPDREKPAAEGRGGFWASRHLCVFGGVRGREDLAECISGPSSSVQSLSRVRLFATPWTAAHQASLSITNSRSLLKLASIESVMPSNHLILCRPLLPLPSIFPSPSF